MAAADMGAAPQPRSWVQRLLITFNCLLIAGCIAAAAAGGYFYYRFENIPRLDLADGILGPIRGESEQEDEDPGGPQNVLLVGSDTREGQDSESFGTSSETGNPRADTMILVRIDPREEKAAMLSFPRDLWITRYSAAGEDLGKGRINTAFEGGPEQLIATIRRNFRLPIHHYAQVNFAGFRDVVNAVGGVELYLAGPVRDRDASGKNVAGLDVPQSGCVTLNGDQALAYVRSRHFEQFVDGRWVPDLSADLGRIQRQQDFIRRAVRAALSEGLTNPSKLTQLLDVADENIVVDDELAGRDVVNIGRRFRSLSPETLDQRTLVVEDFRTSAGASVLRLADDPENEATFDLFRGITRTPEAVSPSAVQVRVLNGTGRSGEASGARDALATAGFEVVGIGDGTYGNEVTTVRYAAGQVAKADLVARYLTARGARMVEDESLAVDVVLTTGADYEGVLTTPRPPTASPEEPEETEDEAGDEEAEEDDPTSEC